jgi:hypothetical protein
VEKVREDRRQRDRKYHAKKKSMSIDIAIWPPPRRFLWRGLGGLRKEQAVVFWFDGLTVDAA